MEIIGRMRDGELTLFDKRYYRNLATANRALDGVTLYAPMYPTVTRVSRVEALRWIVAFAKRVA